MARDFDGIDDGIDCGVHAADDTAVWTIAAWINPDTVGENNNGRIMGRSPGTSRGHMQGMTWTTATVMVREAAGNNNETASARSDAADNSFPLGAWNHFAATYDNGGDRKIRIYKRGVETAYKLQQAATGTLDILPTATFLIGNSTDSSRSFDGRIAHVAVWNVVLTTSEMRMHADGGLPRPQNCIRFMPLWGVASPEPDLSGNGRNGTVVGAVRAAHAPVGPYASAVSPAPETVAAAGGTVGSQTAAVWNVRSAVAQPRAALWDIRTAAGQTRAALWNVAAAVTQARQAVWNVGGPFVATTPPSKTDLAYLDRRSLLTAAQRTSYLAEYGRYRHAFTGTVATVWHDGAQVYSGSDEIAWRDAIVARLP